MISSKPPPPPPRSSRPPPPRPSAPPPSGVPLTDAQHKDEERRRREKRKASKHSNSGKAEARKEHTRRILAAQKGSGTAPPPPPGERRRSHSSKKAPSPAPAPAQSAFQAHLAPRSLGLLVDWRFRNELPRPPVGPLLAGPWSGPDAVLRSHFAPRRGASDAENAHTWRLHAESDLGVPVDVVDIRWYEGRSAKEEKEGRRRKRRAEGGGDADDMYVDMEGDAEGEGGDDGDPTVASGDAARRPAGGVEVVPGIERGDRDLVEWKGGSGDSAADALKARRDRLRQVAPGTEVVKTVRRTAGGKIIDSATTAPTVAVSGSAAAAAAEAMGNARRAGKETGKAKSRVLNQPIPSFMKRTTYVANDQYKNVHQFTSQAKTNEKKMADLNEKLRNSKNKRKDVEWVKKGFETMAEPNMKREHPTNKKLRVVSDLPFLPDAPTWGYDYTHVLLDNLPRAAGASDSTSAATTAQMETALVSDVITEANTSRMRSNLLVPRDPSAAIAAANGDEGRAVYDVMQQYTLEVTALREEGIPAMSFVIFVDGSSATYHPLDARVLLSSGRAAGPEATGRSIGRVEMDKTRLADVNRKMVEVNHSMSDEEDEDDDL